MSNQCNGCLEALVPRGLISISQNVSDEMISNEGLCPLKINWNDGKISSLEFLRASNPKLNKLALPRLPEPHAHLDKAFTWNEYPNLKGTYEGALEANFREHKSRNFDRVKHRADRALNQAIRNGIRAIRSHVDSLHPAGEESWNALLDLQSNYRELIELQLVALAPLNYWTTTTGRLFAKKISNLGGLLGGVCVPPFRKNELRDSFKRMLNLADSLGCGIDLHIDESECFPAAGLNVLAQVLDEMTISIPITCSHASSMGLLTSRAIARLADRLANHKIKIVALPLTNAWLLGRLPRSSSTRRPIAPVSELQRSGVIVAVGGDNVQDPWFPAGSFDPISLIASSLPLLQLEPWNRLGLAPFTTSSAYLMNLNWDGIIGIGSPADLILLEAESWSDAIASLPQRKILINGLWMDQNHSFEKTI